ncbi:hypothetical protein [Streptomyces sp. AB3(2024)]|uniref:hypothetical protein n=1 Tax=Streptomyces sp. AB3(2024) TaxID=3317321 RepID=UPI0035A345F8
MSFEHPAERHGDGRIGRFGKLAELASNFTSSAAFSVVCLALVAGVVVHLAGLPLGWQLFAGDMMTAVSLLLLALLKNAERRAEHAIQQKLDAIAAALLEQQRGEPGRAARRLREAIRAHDEV